MSKSKRFIAGATCPECGVVDKLFVETEENGDRMRGCVACGYSEQQRFDDFPAELETRVNRSQRGKQEETQAVKLLIPDSDG